MYILFALLRDQTRLTTIVRYIGKATLKLDIVGIFITFPIIHICIRLIYSINDLMRKRETIPFVLYN